MEIRTRGYTSADGEKALWDVQFHAPHLLKHRQPAPEGKAKTALASLGLSFNDLMFPLLRQVMKASHCVHGMAHSPCG